MLIIGEKELEDGVVSVRKQGEGDQGKMTIEELGKMIQNEVFETLKFN